MTLSWLIPWPIIALCVLLLTVELAAANTHARLLTLSACGTLGYASINCNAFLEKWVSRGSQF